MNKLALCAAMTLALVACDRAPPPAEPAAPVAATPAPPPEKTPAEVMAERLDAALAGAHRSDANKARDQYRHPKDTLLFFGLVPGMTVVEITPGGGWFSEVLAPALKDGGKLVAALADPATVPSERAKEYLTKANADFRAKIAADPTTYAAVEVIEFKVPEPVLGAPGSADMVVTFRNVHNFTMWKSDAAMFKAFFDVLKPNGVLGVTDHRAAPGTDAATSAETGYVSEDYVIQLATDAGFQIADKTEINANPKDTKDHPQGVWTLPPTLALGDQDKDKYLAIGESDRMTLKFVKPAAPTAPADPNATAADSFEAQPTESPAASPAGG
jgi:predicted methyltransferase